MNIYLQKMTVTEKLKTMELLWDGLCHSTTDLPSPGWHGEIIEKREKQLSNGADDFQDWLQAKKEIWNSNQRFSGTGL